MSSVVEGIDVNKRHSSVVCIFVCSACEGNSGTLDGGMSTGQRLVDMLTMRCAEIPEIKVIPVDCLAVCDRPVTIAFQAQGKWSYTIGDVDPELDLDDIVVAGKLIAISTSGLLKMAERPKFFRNGVVSRLPSLTSLRVSVGR